MADPSYIDNPRRAPRAPARCFAKVICASAVYEAETEDVGSHGCQLVSPRQVKRGDPVKLTIGNPALPDALRVAGRVAWTSAQAPWRVGIAFDEVEESRRWFDRLVAAHGIVMVRRVPDRIAADAMVYLGTPPRLLVDFDRHEAAILRAVGSGNSVGELRARLRDDWPAKQRALFSLLAHQRLTLSRGASAHPDSWRKILGELEATFAVEELKRTVTPLPMPLPPPIRSVPAQAPVGERTFAPAAPAQAARGAGRVPEGFGGWGATGTPVPDFQGAGVGWRAEVGPRVRPPEAQACYDRALEELQRGRVGGALALLRRALALSPGDAEIAAELGKLAFRASVPDPAR